MQQESPFPGVPGPLADALTRRGFASLTPVQEAVLDPALAGRDLRITSRTGSGKTVAVGFAMAEAVTAAAALPRGENQRGGRPAALVIAPTRELAVQIGKELAWLFEPVGGRVTSVTGGTGYGGELRTLRMGVGPTVITATPGRLLDHLERGSIDPSALSVVVLDEADQMLDLGFRDDLEAIMERLPAGRTTHLVSATFPPEVLSLANRFQNTPANVLGSPAGTAHADIAHVIHLVRPDERLAAVRNLLLLAPGERTLAFVRTRADAGELAELLMDAGFSARALHGDMEQEERTRTLDAFRAGRVMTLVATDVAARGLDVPEVSRVIHVEPPSDSEAYTHRSGRTGRAGRKGTSLILASLPARERVLRVLRRAGVTPKIIPLPTADDVRKAASARVRTDLTEAANGPQEPRFTALAEELLAEVSPVALVATLLARANVEGPSEPQNITNLSAPENAPPRGRTTPGRGPTAGGFVAFQINWGSRHGADARRLMAMLCRRGDIRGTELGSIQVGDTMSTFEVSSAVAEGFAEHVKRPDARDPKIRIRPALEASGPLPAGGPSAGPPRAPRPWKRPDFTPQTAVRSGEGESAEDRGAPTPEPHSPAPRDFTQAPHDGPPREPAQHRSEPPPRGPGAPRGPWQGPPKRPYSPGGQHRSEPPRPLPASPQQPPWSPSRGSTPPPPRGSYPPAPPPPPANAASAADAPAERPARPRARIVNQTPAHSSQPPKKPRATKGPRTPRG
jgi:ATP-dependent RNA helicase DeaD